MTNGYLATKEEMKAEAISRMKTIGLGQEYIDAFEKDYEITCFSVARDTAELIDEMQDNLISTYEKDEPKLVWALIHDRDNDDGEDWDCYALLYVSNNKDKWEEERAEMNYGSIPACVISVGEESGRQCNEDRYFHVDVVKGRLVPDRQEFNTVYECNLYKEVDEEGNVMFHTTLEIKDNGMLYIESIYPNVDGFRICFDYLKHIPYDLLCKALGSKSYQETMEKIRDNFGFYDVQEPFHVTFANTKFRSYLISNNIPFTNRHSSTSFFSD